MPDKIIDTSKFSQGTIVRQSEDGKIIVDFTKKNAGKLRKKPQGYENTIQAPRPAIARNPLPYARMHRFGKWRTVRKDKDTSASLN
jgi:hypothetical protein